MREYLILHTIALACSVLLDWIVGDPYNMPHPIRLIGSLIAYLDKKFMGEAGDGRKNNPNREYMLGFITCAFVCAITGASVLALMILAYTINIYVGLGAEIILGCYALAAKSLSRESSKVYKALTEDNIEGARYAVSMIVGRDTASLDRKGITKAAVETVAENTSDGVIAPLVYLFIGGPVLAFLYKAVNTLDSMIGYHNDRYEYFGKVSARLDDIVNFVPARISAFLMIGASFIYRIVDRSINPVNAYRIFIRDRFNHKSPNSAQTESVCAGALGLELLGDASYFGVIVHKPTVGDRIREIEDRDILRANVLMYVTQVLTFIVFGLFMLVIICAL